MIKVRLCNIRIVGTDKNYWLNQLEKFAQNMNPKQVKAVEFGKQDIRGGISITIVDHNNCVPQQQFFATKEQMLGFILGVNCMTKCAVSHVLNFHKDIQEAA